MESIIPLELSIAPAGNLAQSQSRFERALSLSSLSLSLSLSRSLSLSESAAPRARINRRLNTNRRELRIPFSARASYILDAAAAYQLRIESVRVPSSCAIAPAAAAGTGALVCRSETWRGRGEGGGDATCRDETAADPIPWGCAHVRHRVQRRCRHEFSSRQRRKACFPPRRPREGGRRRLARTRPRISGRIPSMESAQ